MTALQILDIKSFMNALLRSSLFDHFLLQEAIITEAVTYTIDGAIHRDYLEPDELEEQNLKDMSYMPFSRIRPICFELIKGKKKPGYFKFVFLLSPQNQSSTLRKSGSNFSDEDVQAMYLNLVYKNDVLTCTTGISYKLFSLDKTLEHEWDRLVLLFFKQHNISVEKIS